MLYFFKIQESWGFLIPHFLIQHFGFRISINAISPITLFCVEISRLKKSSRLIPMINELILNKN